MSDGARSLLWECFRWKVIFDVNDDLDANAWWLWTRAGSFGWPL